MTQNSWPTRIKALRMGLGISQFLLAYQLGVSLNTVNRWERGWTQPQGRSIHERVEELEKTLAKQS
tara:strand:- start:800 stop:997 length:198 start_codon:yes stop_codon:yes gene_type:complete